MGGQEKFTDNQHVADNRHDSVRTDCPIACRPGEHQYAEDWHQLIGPNKPSHAEDKVQLNNDVDD